MNLLVAALSGLLFGLGMAISGMVDPAKVIGFLDVAGNWDPSLAFVMGGALAVFMPAYFFLIKPRSHSINGEQYCLPNTSVIDKRLIGGAALFGIGWGIAGVCPGPAIASASYGNVGIWIFIASMLFGSLLVKFLTAPKADKAKQAMK
ncbi:YeeE/YedE family protein [Vibrio rhodolitus]|uniref:YeeE/YedE family protein n=1 Tax=Vibrio rhodolitus TaxID=2231649 RepID=UPI000E0C137E|nr:YeeE/YedE family protein [Vibrio rhodolitus]